MKSIGSHINLNTLLIAVVGFLLKAGVNKLDQNNDLLHGMIVKVENLEQRIDKVETVQNQHTKEIQKIWDRKL